MSLEDIPVGIKLDNSRVTEKDILEHTYEILRNSPRFKKKYTKEFLSIAMKCFINAIRHAISSGKRVELGKLGIIHPEIRYKKNRPHKKNRNYHSIKDKREFCEIIIVFKPREDFSKYLNNRIFSCFDIVRGKLFPKGLWKKIVRGEI